ncbi:LLM class flavin-dependent oxidoreductase [Streptomyces sp. NPDC021098]|uniref:LLM class flavin-dependent oxidoreductase n=1 Tax=unclassified Streptomyces TaxID=2593676 RepID=UPI0037B2B60B
MTELSVLIPFVPRRLEQVLPFAGLVNWTSAARLWQGQSMVLEPHQTFVGVAGAGFRVPAGLGVTLMPLRNPFEAATQARSVALATGHPVTAGFGTGAVQFQRNILGSAYSSPLNTARAYVTAVRSLLDGELVQRDGPEFTLTGQLPLTVAPRVDVGLGVLRPGMASLAGEVADAVITWLTPPSYLKDVLVPAVAEGMKKAGRTRRPRIIAMVPVGLRRDETDPERLALASNLAHLQAPHYQDMLRRAGADIGDGNDVHQAARAVVDTGGFVTGDLDDVLKGLDAYRQAGADEIVLNTTGVNKMFGPPEAMADLRTLLKAHQ